jgi:hypothetical protein
MHCPFKIFKNWHLIRVYTCNEKFLSFSFTRPLLPMSQVGLVQKVLKIASLLECACSKPRNFLLAERIGVVT